MTLPACHEHRDPITKDPTAIVHPPVLCRTEHVWHPIVCKERVTEKVPVIRGTHSGHLNPEARARRLAKNARNAGRRGESTRPRGSQRSGR